MTTNYSLIVRLAFLFFGCCSVCQAQQVLSLDSCRAMALRNNKQMGVARMKQQVAADMRRSARTKYLPHVSAVGTYQHTNKTISLLSDEQKSTFGSLGTTLSALGLQGFEEMGNAVGQKLVDALDTDTRNIFAGTVMAVQPVYMGGAIVAANKMADLHEEYAENATEAQRQEILFSVEEVYWRVVSLRHKQRLAESYVALVRQLDDDVQRMIREGVATRSDGLTVSVKVNEGEMVLQKVADGLSLSKMQLCQMVGLPLDSEIELPDESAPSIQDSPRTQASTSALSTIAFSARPELRMLDNAVSMAQQTTNILRAGNLPQIVLTGGYAISNPALQNGFEKKFRGFWNVGVTMRVPLWNWGDVKHKVRASKGAEAIAKLEREEAREKIELQVSQSSFRIDEADKRLSLALASVERADENLRTANLGFHEGVITPTAVMEAQTAWLQAQSEKIDAEIDVRLGEVNLRKSLGTLGIDN